MENVFASKFRFTPLEIFSPPTVRKAYLVYGGRSPHPVPFEYKSRFVLKARRNPKRCS